MVPHTWQNHRDCGRRLLALAEPAGELEKFFVEFSKPISEGHPDSGEVAELFAPNDKEEGGCFQ
jgi:hypothetical protein